MSVVEEQPQPQLEAVPVDGRVVVFIADDRMSAEIVVTPPSNGGLPATEDDALAKLQEAGVRFGFDTEAVIAAVASAVVPSDSSVLPTRAVVARGKLAVDGEDATVELHPVLTEVGGRPKVREDGSVDLLDLNLVHNIPADTVLAVITPATPGVPGMRVTGTEIAARPGKNACLRAGKGTCFSEDRLKIVSAVAGHPTVIQGEVTVTDLYRVKGDVGVATGNIRFVGSISVGGSVCRGFKVKAEGDVEVWGTVDGGCVEASGNVFISYGIAAGSTVVAGGSVRARFVESAEVNAGMDVWATDGILQGRVEAGGTIEVLGRRGAIIGGRVSARRSVTARTLGSSMGAPTEIAVGMSERVRLALLDNQKKFTAAEEMFQRIERIVEATMDQERRGALPPDKRAALTRMVREQEQLFSAIGELKARRHELEQEVADLRGAWVQAKDVCHPGVCVTLGTVRYPVGDTLSRPKFQLSDVLDVEVAPQ